MEQPVFIRGLYRDLGEGIFVYSLEDEEGNDGAIEIRPDGQTQLICGETMMQACILKRQYTIVPLVFSQRVLLENVSSYSTMNP